MAEHSIHNAAVVGSIPTPGTIPMTEIPLNHEPEPPISPFDAVLVHCYWPSEGNRFHLGLRTRLADRAAALVYDKGKGARHIVLTGGHLWGPEHPSSAELMKRELTEKYHIPEEAIITKGDAQSTLGEVETFMELAKERGWTRLMSIAAGKHLWTIPGIFKKYGADVVFRSNEEILKDKDSNPHIRHLLKRLGHSKYEFSLMIREAGIWTAMHLPHFNYERLEARNRAKRTGKGKDSIFPGDVYKL